MSDPIYTAMHRNIRACELCRDDWCKLDVAHLEKRSQGGPAIRTNLIMLCRRCHRMFDEGMTRAGRKTMCVLFREKIEQRPGEITEELEAVA